MQCKSESHRPFGFDFLAVTILSPLFGFGCLLAVGIESPVQKILAFPLLLLADKVSPQDPAWFKVALVLNSGIWGIGLAWVVVLIAHGLARRFRRQS